VGVVFGRHKMIPHISPGKTWEGLAGAFLGAFAAAHGMVALFGSHIPMIDHAHAAGLAVALAIITVVADLAESVVKRCLAVKDSGHFLPGIGGALDLIDSLLFTAPAAWLYFHLVVTP
jgi:phosphatidate cytidylyltransferase